MTSILLVTGSSKAAGTYTQLINGVQPSLTVCRAKSCGEARRLMAEGNFAVILIQTPLPDNFGVDLAKDALRGNAGVMLAVSASLEKELSQKLQPEGIFVFSPTITRKTFEGAVRLLLTVHFRLEKAQPSAESMQEKLRDIRMVDRAKCYLIQYEKMTEPEAHRYIEKKAMDQRVPKREVAEEVLRRYHIEI